MLYVQTQYLKGVKFQVVLHVHSEPVLAGLAF